MFATVGMLMFSASLANAPPAFAMHDGKGKKLVLQYDLGDANQVVVCNDIYESMTQNCTVIDASWSSDNKLDVSEFLVLSPNQGTMYCEDKLSSTCTLGTETDIWLKRWYGSGDDDGDWYQIKNHVRIDTSCSNPIQVGDKFYTEPSKFDSVRLAVYHGSSYNC